MARSVSGAKCYWLDIILVGLLVATGASHEWPRTNHQVIGVLFGAGVSLHAIWHWRWLSATARRFFGPLSGRTRFTFVVNVVGLLAMLGAVLGGLAISSWVPWRPSYALVSAHHAVVAVFFLAALLHVGMHANHIWRETAARLLARGQRAPME